MGKHATAPAPKAALAQPSQTIPKGGGQRGLGGGLLTPSSFGGGAAALNALAAAMHGKGDTGGPSMPQGRPQAAPANKPSPQGGTVLTPESFFAAFGGKK